MGSKTALEKRSNGVLPKGWKVIRFDQIASNIAQRVDPIESDSDVYVGLEHLDSESLKIRRWGSPDDVIGQKLKFKKGDVIFDRRRAYQRKLAVADIDGICSAHAMVVRSKPDVLVEGYLAVFMQSDEFMERAQAISVGSLSPTINWKTMRMQEFLLPPKPVQDRIVELQQQASEVIQHRIEVGEAMNDVFASTLHHLLNKGKGRAKLKETPIGKIPIGWEPMRVGDVVSFQGGSQPPRDVFEYRPREGNIRLMQIRDYKSDEFATYIPRELAKRFCTADDVMIGRYGPPIFQILRGIEGSYNVALIKTLPAENVLKGYLYFFLRQRPLFERIEHLSQRSSGQTGVDMDALMKYPFPLPSIPEQTEIVRILEGMEASVELNNDYLSKTKDLRHRLFASALRGDLL